MRLGENNLWRLIEYEIMTQLNKKCKLSYSLDYAKDGSVIIGLFSNGRYSFFLSSTEICIDEIVSSFANYFNKLWC